MICSIVVGSTAGSSEIFSSLLDFKADFKKAKSDE
jgi:hypothetical protein